MVILKAKLLALKKAEEKAELDELRGDVQASWGDQMRNYVLNPYQMVKDLRTEYEVGNPQAVFDGDIDGFLEAGIRWRRGAEQAGVGLDRLDHRIGRPGCGSTTEARRRLTWRCSSRWRPATHQSYARSESVLSSTFAGACT